MTDMTNQQREAFEAWAVANKMTASGDREDRLDYPLGRCLWKAWQAATAAERERAIRILYDNAEQCSDTTRAILQSNAEAIRAG